MAEGGASPRRRKKPAAGHDCPLAEPAISASGINNGGGGGGSCRF
jgi:hypothetical protein